MHAASYQVESDKRGAERRAVTLAGRITWKDARGTTRLATVKTRNVSHTGVLVECQDGPPIPLHRLVNFHVDRSMWNDPGVPAALRRSQVLAAIYRVGPFKQETGRPDTYALRLMVKPDRRKSVSSRDAALQQVIDGCSELGRRAS